MTKTVIFDLGKVILPFDLKRGYAALQPHCSLSVEEIPKRIATTDLVRRFESGQMQPELFVRELSTLLGLEIGYDRFCEMWSSIFLPDTLIPESLVEDVHRRHRVLLLSNTNAIHFDMVRERYPILRHFDGFVLSHEVGAMKPDPKIYQEAIRMAECSPGECFFTDDIAAYVEGARKLGMDAVQFESYPQLQQELRARQIIG